MAELRAEISQQFTPSLPKHDEPFWSDGVLTPTRNHGGGIFGTLRNQFEGNKTSQAHVSEQSSDEKLGGTAAERAKALFQLLLDKVELQVDIHRRASASVNQVEFSLQEVQEEISRMKAASREVVDADGVSQRERIWREDTPQEVLENAARSHLRSNTLRELKTSQSHQTAEISDADIVSGKLSMADLMSRLTTATTVVVDTTKTSQEDPILAESKHQVAQIIKQINSLMTDQSVVEQYQRMSHDRVDVLRQVREASYGKKALRDIGVMQEKLTRQVFLDKRTFSPAEEQIIKRNQLIARAIEQRVADLISNPEVFDLMRWRTLREYQTGLKRDRFAETPSREKMVTAVRRMWSEGRKILATGPTGSGKTELFLHAARALFDTDPERVTGHELLTAFEIYGKFTGKGFEAGPLTRAIDGDHPFVIDEVNVIPNRILMRLKTDLNARPGQDITIQEENGLLHQVGDGFVVGATANVKSEKHPDREKLDPALVRMFESLQVDYLPKEELHDIMLASLMDIQGGIHLSSKDDLNALAELCQATAWIQQAYQGYAVDLGNGEKLYARGGESTGKVATLREAVLDPGKAFDMVNGWEDSRLRGKTLREHMNEKIIQFVRNENFPEEDRYHLVRIFALNEFLRGVQADDLGLSGLDQSTLDAWNGFTGKRIKPGEVYLSSEQVAKIDPFGVLQRPDSSAVEDLLGEDETIEQEFEDDGPSPITFKSSATQTQAASSKRPKKPDASGQILLDILDAGYPLLGLPTDPDRRFRVYAQSLRTTLERNPSTAEEVMRRFEIIIQQNPDDFFMSTFLDQLLWSLEHLKEKGQPIPQSVSSIMAKVNKYLSSAQFDNQYHELVVDKILDLLAK